MPHLQYLPLHLLEGVEEITHDPHSAQVGVDLVLDGLVEGGEDLVPNIEFPAKTISDDRKKRTKTHSAIKAFKGPLAQWHNKLCKALIATHISTSQLTTSDPSDPCEDEAGNP